MRKPLTALTCLLALSSGAQTTLIQAKGGSAVYLDESSVRQTGLHIAATTITNFDKPQDLRAGRMYLTKNSLKSEVLLDCATKRFQVVDSIWYDGANASGPGHRFGSTTQQWFGPEWKHYDKSANILLFPKLCK